MIGVEQDRGVAPAISVRQVWFSKVRSGEEREGTKGTRREKERTSAENVFLPADFEPRLPARRRFAVQGLVDLNQKCRLQHHSLALHPSSSGPPPPPPPPASPPSHH
ncbi:hypothetical protein LXL04_000898 [Taraxacum kok-saghyz]